MIGRSTQRGGVLLMALAALMLAGLGFMLIDAVKPEARLRAQDDATNAALAQAKEALLGYAATYPMGKLSTGNLLCPAGDDKGSAETKGSGCAGAANQARRLGRVPWSTLGAPEARDGTGEQLWYAVSDNFRSFQAATSNSDTSGTITIRDSAGNLLHDASIGAGVAAVILAPGRPLTTPRLQNRPGNSAADYLDIALGEDNASFKDGTTDGFIMGPVRASDGRLLAWAEINSDQLPFPAPIESSDYRSTEGTLFGRVPQKFTRNPSVSISRAIAKLQTARERLLASTSQTQAGATLAMNRANTSLIFALSGTTSAANDMATRASNDLLAKIETTALDPLVSANGQTAPASSFALDPALSQTVKNAFLTLANATSATLSEARTLQKTEAKTVKTLTTYIGNILTAASGIVLSNRSVLVNMDWLGTSPNCSWLDPARKNSKGEPDPSGWAKNQWFKHIYFQIDQRDLVRNSDGTPAPGGLTINGRGGYQLVVIAPGRAIGAQTRGNVFNPSQFFEGENAHPSRSAGATNPSKSFEQRLVSANFNDRLAY